MIAPDVPDEILVEAAQRGDRPALEQLLRRHHARIYALCRRMTCNDADAQDATQEALMALVRGLHRFDGRAAFTTWMYRVATNACLDELRRRRRRPEPVDPQSTPGDDGQATPGARALSSGPSGGRDVGPSIDETVSDRLDIDDALRQLKPEYRAAVVLRDQIGLEYSEIAETLDIPVGTVRSRIARGRAALADTLGTHDEPSVAEPSGNLRADRDVSRGEP